MPGTGVAAVAQSLFRRTTTVDIEIAVGPERVWDLLTDAARMHEWTETVSRVEGRIARGERLEIRTPGSTGTFRPKVTVLEPGRRMVWADGQAPMFKGVRTFELAGTASGTTFTVRERFGGLMLPLLRRSLPDVGPVLERYAADLKAAAEGAGRR